MTIGSIILLYRNYENMKAIILTEPGSTDNLVIQDIPTPAIHADEVLVQVKSISINPVDVKTRIRKREDNGSAFIIGWDISGVVTASNSDLFKAGDEVFGMVNFPGIGNAYAEYVAAPASHLALKPANISHEEAAAATLALLTAWQVLVTNADIKPGDRVLIHAAAGGVGHYAVQIAKYLGAYVIGTSSAANKNFVLSLGANEHIDYTSQILKDAAKDIDFILDSLGEASIDQSLDVIKDGGKIISILPQVTDMHREKAAARNISISFVLVKSDGDDMNTLAALLESGKIKSHVSKSFTFNQMADAHLQVESGRTVGKIVVNV
jgi:NADPH:quinone reductase-like Zn-dependent oxidoreductase